MLFKTIATLAVAGIQIKVLQRTAGDYDAMSIYIDMEEYHYSLVSTTGHSGPEILVTRGFRNIDEGGGELIYSDEHVHDLTIRRE